MTLHAGGLVLVTQADVEVARAQAGIDVDVEVEIELRPTLDDAHRPITKARVTVAGNAILEDFTVAAIEDLVTTGDCAEIPGLHVAAQGRGEDVYVGPLEAAKQDCANPSQFDKKDATLSGLSLEFTPSWVAAYVGSPALASSRNSVSDVQWDLILEGSNNGPELEPTVHIGYALGHARVATDEGDDWPLDGWESSESPKVGDDPPSCLDDSCPDNRSLREPHLLAELNDQGELRDLVLSFARELVTNPSERDLFGIQIVRPVGGPTTPIALPSMPTLSPDDIPECVSLRDPALIPVDPDATARLLAALHVRRGRRRSDRNPRGSNLARARSHSRRGQADEACHARRKRARAVRGSWNPLTRTVDLVRSGRHAASHLVLGPEHAGRLGGGACGGPNPRPLEPRVRSSRATPLPGEPDFEQQLYPGSKRVPR